LKAEFKRQFCGILQMIRGGKRFLKLKIDI